MSEQAARQFFEAMSAGDAGSLTDRVTEDVVLEFPGSRFGGRFQGKRKIVIFLRQNQRLFEGGLRFQVVWAGACGDRTVVQWTNEGVTREGRPYANRGVTVFRFEGGLVAEIQDYLDTERIAETWPR